MGFDVAKFQKQELTRRTAAVPVNELAPFFQEGETPEWHVRGLSGIELARINEAASSNAVSSQLLSVVAGGFSTETVEKIQEMLGMMNDTPADFIRMTRMLEVGSVDPVMTQEASIKLGSAFPVELKLITTKIAELTGKGSFAAEKPEPCGTTP
jgi:hypothetical protein